MFVFFFHNRGARFRQRLRDGQWDKVALEFDTLPAPQAIADSSIEVVLPPDQLMAWLRATCPTRFRVNCGADTGGATWFWEALRISPAGAELWRLHPWLEDRSPAQLSHHLPLVFV